jgi:hypothetical protein
MLQSLACCWSAYCRFSVAELLHQVAAAHVPAPKQSKLDEVEALGDTQRSFVSWLSTAYSRLGAHD